MGNQRATECMYCHDATSGATSKKPYELATLPGETVRGEHTLGVTSIPDSDANNFGQETGILGRRDPASGQGRVLQCWQCHSVHGSNTIGTTNAVEGNTYDASDAVENWNSKILRLDPANDGSVLAKGSGGLSVDTWQGQLDIDAAAVRTGFCADCHTLNPNWEIDSDDTTRPNPRSHPQGPGTDSQMEVYGTTKTVAAHPMERFGCRGCHVASVGDSGNGISRFPHQSRGWKLLYDEATMTGGTTDLAGSPQRVIPKMDAVCLSCHSIFEDLDTASGGGEESGCLYCHDSKYGASDVGDEIRKASSHPIQTYANRHDYDSAESATDLGIGNRHAECADCHDAQKVLPWQDEPLADIWGVMVSSESTDTTPGLALQSPVDFEWQLCFKCHSSYTTQPNSSVYETTDTASPNFTAGRQGDKAFEFNTNNTAFHPVRIAGRNKSANLDLQLAAAGLSTSSKITCSDCHNTDETSTTLGWASNSPFTPQGPHGSRNNTRLSTPNNLVLRGMYWTGYRNAAIAIDPQWAGPPNGLDVDSVVQLCFVCHDFEKQQNTQWWGDGARTNFYQGSSTVATSASPEANAEGNLHNKHFIRATAAGKRITCRNCHYNIHSNQVAWNTEYRHNKSGGWVSAYTPPDGVKTHLLNISPDATLRGGSTNSKPQWSIDVDTGSGTYGERTCDLRCHGQPMDPGAAQKPAKYGPPPEGDDPNLTF